VPPLVKSQPFRLQRCRHFHASIHDVGPAPLNLIVDTRIIRR